MSKRTFKQSSSSDWPPSGQSKPGKKKSKQSYYNMVKYVDKPWSNKPELQFYDEKNTLNPTNVTTGASGIISLLNGMTQGVGAAQFQGNKITLKSIYLRIVMSGVSGTYNQLRYALIVDNKSAGVAGTVPAFSDVFKLAYIAGTDLNSPLNLDEQRGRFQVLLDRFTVLCDVGGTTLIQQKDHYVKVNMPITWNTNPAAYPRDILFVSLSSQPTSTPTVIVQSRLRYYNN